MFLLDNAMIADASIQETADDRLNRLKNWATVNPDGTAVLEGTQPDYKHFRGTNSQRTSFPFGGKVEGKNYNMVNILIWSNYEIAYERFLNYKRLIKDTQEYLNSLLKLYELEEDFEVPEDSKGPEYRSLIASKSRLKALKLVQRDALRRVVSIYLLLGLDLKPLEEGEHYLEYAEMKQRILAYKNKEQTPRKDPPPIAFDWKERLDNMRDAIKDITDNYVGNEGLKNSIYEDIVAFLTDGAASMNVYRNYVFMGPSGVGKTTWAILMGKIYKALGIYMKGIVNVTKADDYVGSYIGWSGPQTTSLLDANLENIVLIDEAYGITESKTDSGKSSGAESITALVDYMDKNKGCLMIIIAGYEDKMQNSFLKENEGLDRRFKHKVLFNDYEPSQMVEILKMGLQKKGIDSLFVPETWVKLQMLIQMARDMFEKSKRTLLMNEYEKKLVLIHEQAFSKQAGSMTNILEQMVAYCSLPDHKPERFGRKKYDYIPDVVAVIASVMNPGLHDEIRDAGSVLRQIFENAD